MINSKGMYGIGLAASIPPGPVCKALEAALRCPAMYQVYSIQRPGHPRWALAASGLLLVASVGLAWGLIHAKSRGTYMPLEDQSRDYPARGIRARLPSGWEALDGARVASLPAVVAAVAAPEESDRVACIFRGNRQRLGVPSAHVLDVLEEAFVHLRLAGDVETEPAMIGPFFARTVRSTAGDRIGKAPGSHFLARVAFAPDGQTFGILLLLPRKPTPRDEQLLGEMGQHLQLLTLSLDESPARLMADAGIRFDPPTKARFVKPDPPPGPPSPQLRLMSDDPATCWYLSIWRVPLLGTRTCAQLVESLALTTLRQGRLRKQPVRSTVAGHEVARLSISPDEEAQPRSGAQIWCVQMDGDTALFLVGHHEAEAGPRLSEVCESIVAGVSLSGTDSLVDTSAALEVGRRYLREIAAEKLTSKWGDLVDRRQRFVLRGLAGVRLQEETSYQVARREDGSRWWRQLTTYSLPGPLAAMAPAATDEWVVRDDASGHEGRVRWPASSGTDERIEYLETRSPGGGEVVCSLSMPQKEPRDWTLGIDDNYACQPVLLEAAAKAARDPDRHVALFSTSEVFNPHLSWVMANPLGELPLPGSEEDRSVAAVRLWTDYEDEPEILYFDESDHLMGMSLERDLHLERESRSFRRDDSRSFFDRRQRP